MLTAGFTQWKGRQMSTLISTDDLFQRSRARVKGLGEVFTPEAYVEDMLKILSQDKRKFWSDDNIAFFEPISGFGLHNFCFAGDEPYEHVLLKYYI